MHDEWAARTMLRGVGERFRDGWRASTSNTRRRFIATLLVGFLVLLGVEVAAALAADHMIGDTAPDIELAVAHWFADLPVARTAIRWLDVWGNALVTWPIAFLAAGMAAWRHRAFRAIGFLGGYAATEAFTLIGWAVWSRPRPTFADPDQISWNGFPSGHVLHVLVLGGLLVWAWTRASRRAGEKILAWSILVVVTLGVSIIRLRMTMHWPADVLAALFIGIVWTAVVVRAIESAERDAPNETSRHHDGDGSRSLDADDYSAAASS